MHSASFYYERVMWFVAWVVLAIVIVGILNTIVSAIRRR